MQGYHTIVVFMKTQIRQRCVIGKKIHIIGKSALEKIKAEGAAREMLGFEVVIPEKNWL